MVRVIRIDAATLLRSPVVTAQGFLRVDGYAGKVGIYDYMNADGTTRRELRLPEEVFSAATLASFEGAPLTDGHPMSPVTPSNVKHVEVGTVTGPGRKDGEHVATGMVIKNEKTIAKVKAGKQQLSPGYALDLDMTPGVHPQWGRYDAVQRNIEVNHLAIVDEARGGSSVRMRMDSADARPVAIQADMMGEMMGARWPNPQLTSIVDGHQHTIDVTGICNETSWAVSAGADCGHSHAWVRGEDGSIIIAENAGHSHTVESTTSIPEPATTRGDQGVTKMPEPIKPATTINHDEALRSLEAQLHNSELKLREVTEERDSHKLRADSLKGELDVVQKQIPPLQAQLASLETARETAEIRKQVTRADEAEKKVLQLEKSLAPRIKERVALERKAAAVMGDTYRMDDLNDRQIMAEVVRHLDKTADVSDGVAVGEIIGQFRTLTKLREDNARSIARVSETLATKTNEDVHAAAGKRSADAWKKPLPNASIHTSTTK